MLKNIYSNFKTSKLSEPIRFIRKEFLARKHWRILIKSMKKQNQSIPYINKPGIAFSFDDSFRINDWYRYGKDMFGFYDVKVTFNINAFHHFEGNREHTQDEIDMLLELQANGHELAHHGYSHRDTVAYSNEVGLRNWIEEEIKPLFDWMDKQSHSKTKEKFKKPLTFAYPYTAYSEEINSALVPQYFKIVRGGFDKHTLPLPSHTGYSTSICIDRNQFFNLKYFKRAMKIAKKTGTNLIIMCHSILPDEVDWEDFGWGEEAKKTGEYRTSPKTIESIIKEARKNNMEFYTTAEIAGIATFTDPNFENYIREEVLNSSDKWILIKDLLSIKELDLNNKNISNLGGIQYFLNLEKLNLGDNNITDLRLIEKLPNLKSLDIRDNSVKKKIVQKKFIASPLFLYSTQLTELTEWLRLVS